MRIGTTVWLASVAALAACGTNQGAAGDDDDDGGGPDGGIVEPGELRATILDTIIRDERGDQIAIGDAPQHVHAGDEITLGAAGCPAVFKYSYLLDAQIPFGQEQPANPLAWRFAVENADVVAQTDYRVRTAAATVLDWTPTTADAAGKFPIQLFRSGATGIPELQATTQQFFIDFRVRDDRGREAMATGCWEHHPLAPPVDVVGLSRSQEADALAQLSLAANSPVSRILTASAGVNVFTARIDHTTAEQVLVKLQLPIPSGGFSKTVVSDLIPEVTNQTVGCGITCVPNTICVPEPAEDPRCATVTPSEPADPTTTGALGDDTWTVRVLDARTGQAASECTIAQLTVTCALAGRQVGALPKVLIVQLVMSGHRELSPSLTGTVGEFTFQGLTYTGLDIAATEKKFRCENLVTAQANGDGERFRSCTRFTTFHKLVALDNLRVSFDAPALTIATAIPPTGVLPGTELAPPTHIPSGVVAGANLLWDSGGDDLPGPQH